MKRTISLLLVAVMCLVVGCSSGVSQEEYDKVVAEREALAKQVEKLGGKAESTPAVSAKPKTGTFDAESVKSQLEYTEYTWKKYVALVIKNNSDRNIEIDVNMKFKDGSGSLIGTKNDGEHAFESGQEIVFVFYNDTTFDSYEYDVSVSEEKYYTCVLSSIECEVNTTDKKAILSVTNTGEKAAEFVEYTILYMNGDNVVGYDWGYATDNDSEIKPGKTINKEGTCYEPFDHVQVYFTGRANK